MPSYYTAGLCLLVFVGWSVDRIAKNIRVNFPESLGRAGRGKETVFINFVGYLEVTVGTKH